MRATLITAVAALPVLISAHEPHLNAARHQNFARQASASQQTTFTASVAAASSSTGSASSSSSVSTTSAATATTPTASPISVSLLSVNPSAVPTVSIVSGSISQATHAMFTTASAGAVPTWAPHAPPLPNIATLSPADYPALDKPPPTDSPQVQQWINDVANSGVKIPNITATAPGGCPANLAAVADDANRCWWTCGGCTRNTDITTCPNKFTWGLTYDDGPAPYTPDLLSYLNTNNLTGTFFAVGSRVISYPAMLQAEYMLGHQIGVHTWSHPSLTTLTNEEIIAELGWSKKVITDTLGVTPNTMRPPYGDIDDRVRAISMAMGLTPVIWTRISPQATFDTGDFDVEGGATTIGQVLQNWEYILGNASIINTGFIVLEHDLFPQTVDIATGYILPDALAHKNPSFKIEPVVSCLNKPLTDAYIELNDNKTNPPPASGSAVVTLSSGAPGSAQATGSANQDSHANSGQTAAVLGLSTIALGLLAGVAALAF